ncbi:MAG: RDD family protein [Pseudomonadota bacterium]
MKQLEIERSQYQNAGLMRRLGALLYDAALLFSILLLATALATFLNGGNAPPNSAMRIWLVFVTVVFFGGFWRNGGQTLGMRAWRLTLFSTRGDQLRWRDIVLRLLVASLSIACVGAGYWWALVDAQRRTWHDIASSTVLKHLPPTPRS